jgi:hypothetical protein
MLLGTLAVYLCGYTCLSLGYLGMLCCSVQLSPIFGVHYEGAFMETL